MGAAPDGIAQIYMYNETPKAGPRQMIEVRYILIMGRGLCQMMEFRAIWIMGRQKRAVPDDRVKIHMDYGTPKRLLRQTMELGSIWSMSRREGGCAE